MLICENVYHEGDFNKYTNGEYVSEMLVICPKHRQDHITQKSEYDLNALDNNARKIIAQIKLFEKEELRNELCHNLTLNSLKNNSVASESPDQDELSTVKMEYKLLRQLNTELQTRNKMLDNIIANKDCSFRSYAKVTKSKDQPTIRVPKILVKAKNNHNNDTFGIVRNKLTCDLSIPINDVRKSMDGDVPKCCKNNTDVTRAKSVLKGKLGCEYSIELESLKLPKVKVINGENDLNKEDLCEDIYNRNFLDVDGAFNIIADFKNAIGKRTLILEVTALTYICSTMALKYTLGFRDVEFLIIST